MNLILHGPKSGAELSKVYRQAFDRAVELFIVSAYLTEWDESFKLNPGCKRFRLIVGKDFGITRKAACKKAMAWLSSTRKSQFMVADSIAGFHPKALFWKEASGRCFSIIGSSNLTRAAFATNYEANAFSRISTHNYIAAKSWLKRIEDQAVTVSEDWLDKYKEAAATRGFGRTATKNQVEAPIVLLKLPKPPGMRKWIVSRRKQLAAYGRKRTKLIALFNECASKRISSEAFYERLPKLWSHRVGNRLQGKQFEISGKHSDFCAMSNSYLKILHARDADRDDVVQEQIDSLKMRGVPTRRAFLSEFLCLRFPEKYPVWNKPVQKLLSAEKIRAPRGASEGARYIAMAKTLRHALVHDRTHPATNLAELDAVIWLKYRYK